jgi:hypothetical protein
MRKVSAMKLHDGDEVEIRFLPEDTFTPKKWEAGKVVGSPIQKENRVSVSVLLHDGCLVVGVTNERIKRKSCRTRRFSLPKRFARSSSMPTTGDAPLTS